MKVSCKMKSCLALFIAAAILFSSYGSIAVMADAPRAELTLCELFVDNGSESKVLTNGDNRLKARIFSENTSETPVSVKLAAATYTTGPEGRATLSDIRISSVSNVLNGYNLVTVGTFPVADPANTKIKVMVWEGFTSLKPLTVSGSVSDRSSEKNITSFTITYYEAVKENEAPQLRTAEAEINNIDNIIWFETKGGCNIAAAIDAAAAVSKGASIDPVPSAGMSITQGDTFTVTAADGSKKVYTVKFDWQQEDFFNMPMNQGFSEASGSSYPNAVQEIRTKNWGDDNPGLIWQGSIDSFGEGESKIVTTEDGNNYWQYDTTNTATSNRSFKVRMAGGGTENKRKVTYSFDLNMKHFGNSWFRAFVRMGGANNSTYKQHGVAELRILRDGNSKFDDAVIGSDTNWEKYQIQYDYGNGQVANVATLEKGKWYNIKVVVRRNDYKDGTYDGLTEVYINNEVKFSAPIWYASVKGNDLVTCNSEKLNEIGFFELTRDSNASNFICCLDNITCSQTAPDQALGNSVIMVGDSISYIYKNNPVGSEQQGFGYYLKENLIEGGEYTYLDMAQPGNCTVSYLEGSCGTHTTANNWSVVKNAIRSGDYVLLAVGTNDSYHHSKHKNDQYPDNSQERYKDNLKRMVREVEDLGATPILITPHVTAELTVNNDGKTLRNELAQYSGYMKEAYNELIAEDGHTVALIDLNTIMWEDIQKEIDKFKDEGIDNPLDVIRTIYYAGEQSNNFVNGNTNTPDYTHLNETGAEYVACLIVNELRANPTKYYGLGKHFNLITLSSLSIYNFIEQN